MIHNHQQNIPKKILRFLVKIISENQKTMQQLAIKKQVKT
jgi:Zn-finger protein